ncbi:hypothetical protein EVAR_85025_1 [Eumeta japonica]|uniref:Uncharacterized protein n=1 Tax=Eumeta variegata TaxID=151549 RepID=A0A4C1W8S4_EUMVA|nr:hypothetical protein EVAR_85025_1 [Eumeta japonica]
MREKGVERRELYTPTPQECSKRATYDVRIQSDRICLVRVLRRFRVRCVSARAHKDVSTTTHGKAWLYPFKHANRVQ